MPVQINRLSACNFNKHKLQKLSRVHLKYVVQDEQMEVALSEYLNSDTKLNDCVRLRLQNL